MGDARKKIVSLADRSEASSLQMPGSHGCCGLGSELAGFMEKLSARFPPFPRFAMTTRPLREISIFVNYGTDEDFSHLSS